MGEDKPTCALGTWKLFLLGWSLPVTHRESGSQALVPLFTESPLTQTQAGISPLPCGQRQTYLWGLESFFLLGCSLAVAHQESESQAQVPLYQSNTLIWGESYGNRLRTSCIWNMYPTTEIFTPYRYSTKICTESEMGLQWISEEIRTFLLIFLEIIGLAEVSWRYISVSVSVNI